MHTGCTSAIDAALAGGGAGDCNEVCLSIIITSSVLGALSLCWYVRSLLATQFTCFTSTKVQILTLRYSPPSSSLVYCLRRCCKKSAVTHQSAHNVWEMLEWQYIPPQFRAHWEVLGYNQWNWEQPNTAGTPPPPTEGLRWQQLSPLQQASASAVGYSEEMWDAGTPFTCFTGTKAQILTGEDAEPRGNPSELPVLPLMPAAKFTYAGPAMYGGGGGGGAMYAGGGGGGGGAVWGGHGPPVTNWPPAAPVWNAPPPPAASPPLPPGTQFTTQFTCITVN